MKSKLRKIDQRIYELAHDPVANRGELESLEAKSRNTMNAMAVSEARGGIFRIQALSLSLFGLAALCLVAYFWLYPSWAFGLSLATYSFAFTGLSGAFSVATVAVLGRAKHSRRY